MGLTYALKNCTLNDCPIFAFRSKIYTPKEHSLADCTKHNINVNDSIPYTENSLKLETKSTDKILNYFIHEVDITVLVNKCQYIRHVLSHVINKPLNTNAVNTTHTSLSLSLSLSKRRMMEVVVTTGLLEL